MVPNSTPREVVSGPVGSRAFFQISPKAQAHIMTILRDNIYTDRILAVLREYGANAWDANKEAGRGDIPIRVMLPTQANPLLTIRDYGNGLTEDEVLSFYTQYGESTKRSSDSVVGYMGIGCKSAFAYTDSFTISSWSGGKKKIYTAVLDSSNVGEIQKIYEEDSSEDTGVEISVAVRPEDVEEFRRKAEFLFSHFHPTPVTNIQLHKLQGVQLQHGLFVRTDHYWGNSWVAVMGCIPYKIDFKVIQKELQETDTRLERVLSRNTGVIYFDIGEVEISASREELKYTTKTKQAMLQKFMLLMEEYIEYAKNVLESKSNVTDWEKRKEALTFHRTMGYSLSGEYSSLRVRLIPEEADAKPITFTIPASKSGEVAISEYLWFIIHDDERKLTELELPTNHVVIVEPISGATFDEVQAELKIYLLSALLDGVPITKTSSLPAHRYYHSNRKRKQRPPNAKHQRKTFKLSAAKRLQPSGRGCSVNWEVVEGHKPSSEDVFVVLEHFSVVNAPTFYLQVRDDQELLEALGETFPPIYGYKSTCAKPLDDSKCVGIPYRTWKEQTLQRLMEVHKRELSLWHWAYWLEHHDLLDLNIAYEQLAKSLGVDHPVSQLVKKSIEAKHFIQALSGPVGQAYNVLRMREGGTAAEVMRSEVDSVLSQYQLLRHYGAAQLISRQEQVAAWVDYIKAIDKTKEMDNGDGSSVHSDSGQPDCDRIGKASYFPEGESEL